MRRLMSFQAHSALDRSGHRPHRFPSPVAVNDRLACSKLPAMPTPIAALAMLNGHEGVVSPQASPIIIDLDVLPVRELQAMRDCH